MISPKNKPQARLELVDSLRGFALMGLFLVHCVEMYELYWAKNMHDPLTEAVFGVFMGKSFSLLAICFGFSFFIIMDRAKARGVDFRGRFVWRLALIGLMGALHGLLYRGDILMVLALTGLSLLAIDHIKSLAVLWLLVFVLLAQPYLLLQIIAALHGASWANAAPFSMEDPAMPVYLDGTLAAVIRANLIDGFINKWAFMVESGRILQLVALFTVGLILGRVGFFERTDSFRAERRLALLLLAAVWLGLKLEGDAIIALVPRSGAPLSRAPALLGDVLNGLRDLAQMGVMMLVFVAVYQRLHGKILGRLAPVGRMTLTLYLGQSLIFVPVYYGFGLRGHAWLASWQSLAIGVGAMAAQIVFAHLWFRSYYYGPVEWLWRALTYLDPRLPLARTHRPAIAENPMA